MPLTQAQHDARSKGIGSSDAAAACGLNPYRTRADLWLEKTGRQPRPDLDDVEHIRWGNIMEEVVAQQYAERNGAKVRRRRDAYTNGFMIAHIDRLIENRDAVLECKNASEYTSSNWSENGPLHYRLQVHHQLIASRKSLGVLAACVGGNRYVEHDVPPDPELHELIVAKEGEFWSHVERDIPPAVSTAEEVLQIYTAASEKAVEATPELLEFHKELMQLRDEKKRVDERISQIKDAFATFMLDAEIVLGPDGKPIVTWKQAKGSPYVDWQAVANELGGRIKEESIFHGVILAHTKTKPGSRRFLPKKRKTD